MTFDENQEYRGSCRIRPEQDSRRQADNPWRGTFVTVDTHATPRTGEAVLDLDGIIWAAHVESIDLSGLALSSIAVQIVSAQFVCTPAVSSSD
jgi:hypothetical protein